MVITLYAEEIYNAVRTNSHREVAGVEDPDARYRAEAGTEKQGEIRRCILDACARLEGRCSRFLDNSYMDFSDNSSGWPEAFVFDFAVSERRAVGKAAPLTGAMHNFMVEYALSKFYSIVNQGELSNKHSLLAIDEGNAIDQILYTKQPPIV